MAPAELSAVRQRQLLAFFAVLSGILFLGTLLSITTYGVFFPFRWTADYSRKSYGVIIDAGSHGTRGHLYEWSGRVEDPEHPQERPVTVPKEIFTFEPNLKGISQYVYNTSAIGPEVLQPIITAMTAELHRLGISEKELPGVPIYLKATAGMRNMEPDAAEQVFASIRSYLSAPWSGSTTGVYSPFQFEPNWARVISGEEEGVFGWLAVNSQRGTLLDDGKDTIGAMDLGGASAQITFVPTTANVLEDFYEIRLGGKIARLYSHSFLGYGWDDARMRVTTRLALGSIFNAIARDIGTDVVITAEALTQRFLDGRMSSFIHDETLLNSIDANATAPNAIYIDPTSGNFPRFVLRAPHPCFPPGHAAFFDIPALSYPDGRYFLDIDQSAILAYMGTAGYDLQNEILARYFAHHDLVRASADPLNHMTLEPVMDRVTVSFLNTSSSTTAEDLALAARDQAPFSPFKEYLPGPRIKFRLLFEGQGDVEKCEALARQLFYKEPCFLNSCSYNGVYQPNIRDSRFLALGQFAKVRAALRVPLNATPNTIKKRAAATCSTPWPQLTAAASNHDFAPFGKKSISNLCWKSVWVYATLTAGYGFDPNTHSITFFDITNVTGPAKSPGWAEGAMLYEVSGMGWESARGRYQAPFWWAYVTLLSLGILTIIQARKISYLRTRLPHTRSDVYMPFSPEDIRD